MDFIAQTLLKVELPRIIKIREHFCTTQIEDVASLIRDDVSKLPSYQMICPGQRIAITAGSRGIDRLPLVLRTLVEMIKAKDAEPFLVPAMGSHGGATAEGQVALLSELGITSETIGAPIFSSMEVVQIGNIEDGRPVYIDRYAHEADGIILVNRIKAHTGFRGEYESGLMKMMAIGLGKQHGASEYHRTGFSRMAYTVEQVGHAVLQREKIIFGVGLVENGYGKLAQVSCLEADQIPVEEKKLLRTANAFLPRPFFSTADVLVVREMGKDISGTGMDSNVIGRYNNDAISSPEISYTRLAVLDLTEHSKGNANGMGFADYITKRFYQKINLQQTYPNPLTSSYPMTVRIPMILDTDRQAIAAAVMTCLAEDPGRLRLGMIRDTKHLETVYISESMLPEAEACSDVQIESEPFAIPFSTDGSLTLMF